MGITQIEFAAKIGMSGGSIARMERGEMIVTPPMALLIGYVAREAGVDLAVDSRRSRRAVAPKKASRAIAGHTARKSGRQKNPLSTRRR